MEQYQEAAAILDSIADGEKFYEELSEEELAKLTELYNAFVSYEGELTEEEQGYYDLLNSLGQKTEPAAENTKALDLQGQIDAASGKTTITLTEDVSLEKTVTVGSGKDITIVDDGSARTIKSKDGFNECMFYVAPGGKLTFKTSKDDNSLLVLDGSTSKKRTYTTYDAGVVDCEGELVIDGGTITKDKVILRMKGTITVHNKGKVTMNGGEISGNNVCSSDSNTRGQAKNEYTGTGIIRVEGGTFTMNGGKITGNQPNSSTDHNTRGAVIAVTAFVNEADSDPSKFVLNGGEISENGGEYDNDYGYNNLYPCIIGVGYYEWDYATYYQQITLEKRRAVFEMNGGTIRDNDAEGIMNSQSLGDIYINDGVISGNNSIAVEDGGTVKVGTSYGDVNGPVSDDERSHIIMSGGVIENNTAVKGAGLHINKSGKVTLTGGQIINNTATNMGAGLYSWNNSIMNISDALITDNTAGFAGGGIWFCPMGGGNINVTNGLAVFDNTANNEYEGEIGAGDDVFLAQKDASGYNLYISERMLGGGQIAYYKDGGATGGNQGIPDGSPRFDPANPGDKITIENNRDEFANGIGLHGETTENAKALAKQNAKVIITGNTAETRGGGMVINGNLNGDATEEWALKVQKEWLDVPEDKQGEITVKLKIGTYELDEIKLNKENNWTGEYTHMPNPDSLVTDPETSEPLAITVTEVLEDGEEKEYQVSYSDLGIDEDNKTMYIRITNELIKPDEPDPEPEPDKPDTDKPNQDKPNQDKPGNTGSKAPQSGDSADTGLWAILIVAAGSLIGVTAVLNRKKREHK